MQCGLNEHIALPRFPSLSTCKLYMDPILKINQTPSCSRPRPNSWFRFPFSPSHPIPSPCFVLCSEDQPNYKCMGYISRYGVAVQSVRPIPSVNTVPRKPIQCNLSYRHAPSLSSLSEGQAFQLAHQTLQPLR